MMEEEALNSSSHATETLGWLAIETGQNSWGDLNYQASRTGNEVTRSWQTIDLATEFTDSSYLFASLARACHQLIQRCL